MFPERTIYWTVCIAGKVYGDAVTLSETNIPYTELGEAAFELLQLQIADKMKEVLLSLKLKEGKSDDTI